MKTKFASVALCAVLSAFAFGLSTREAHAYLDPGTGSMILQLLLGGVAGAALVGKLYWHKLLVLLGLRQEAPEVQGADDQALARSEPRTER